MRPIPALLLVACNVSPDPNDSPADPVVDLAVECQRVRAAEVHGDEGTDELNVEVFTSGLAIPWAIDWLPDGTALVTERAGTVRRIDANGNLEPAPLATVPITDGGEGGLLGLAVHPDFEENRWIYLYYTTAGVGGVRNVVERWTVSADGTAATADTLILNDIPARQFHNGGRLRFGPDGLLYVGTGDATTPEWSQDPDNLAGKLLRIRDDGSFPDDNPWGSAAVLTGLRNLQAFDFRDDGRVVLADHGPSGSPVENSWTDHDELNVADFGDNLGWPDIYRCQSEEGLRPPSMTWAEALPPGGGAFVPSSAIPSWEGDFVLGVLGFGDDIGHLHRFTLAADGNVERSEVYLRGEYGRMRDVAVGPDGALYVTTSNCDGRATCPDEGDLVLRITGN
ncbi:MAG: PQQ-dependent sugar dehydrogenase [Myxococcota bacterium]